MFCSQQGKEINENQQILKDNKDYKDNIDKIIGYSVSLSFIEDFQETCKQSYDISIIGIKVLISYLQNLEAYESEIKSLNNKSEEIESSETLKDCSQILNILEQEIRRLEENLEKLESQKTTETENMEIYREQVLKDILTCSDKINNKIGINKENINFESVEDLIKRLTKEANLLSGKEKKDINYEIIELEKLNNSKNIVHNQLEDDIFQLKNKIEDVTLLFQMYLLINQMQKSNNDKLVDDKNTSNLLPDILKQTKIGEDELSKLSKHQTLAKLRSALGDCKTKFEEKRTTLSFAIEIKTFNKWNEFLNFCRTIRGFKANLSKLNSSELNQKYKKQLEMVPEIITKSDQIDYLVDAAIKHKMNSEIAAIFDYLSDAMPFFNKYIERVENDCGILGRGGNGSKAQFFWSEIIMILKSADEEYRKHHLRNQTKKLERTERCNNFKKKGDLLINSSAFFKNDFFPLNSTEILNPDTKRDQPDFNSSAPRRNL